MDFVFDGAADGRVVKCVAIVDDAAHEAVATEAEGAIFGHGVIRVLERPGSSRALRKILRSGNAKEFCGQTMVRWARDRGPRCG